MWRDPLDELIEDLEKVVPGDDAIDVDDEVLPVVVFQLWSQACVEGMDEEEMKRQSWYPAIARWQEKLARAYREGTPGEPT